MVSLVIFPYQYIKKGKNFNGKGILKKIINVNQNTIIEINEIIDEYNKDFLKFKSNLLTNNINKKAKVKISKPIKSKNKIYIIDIKKSSELLDALSGFDNAQSVVCADGYIIAIEAVEGTDALLNRSRQLRKDLDQFKTKSGFLVKKIKKSQSRFIDLPVVGPKTISLIKKANLKGLAIDIKSTLVYKKDEFLRLAKEYDLIIYDIN